MIRNGFIDPAQQALLRNLVASASAITTDQIAALKTLLATTRYAGLSPSQQVQLLNQTYEIANPDTTAPRIPITEWSQADFTATFAPIIRLFGIDPSDTASKSFAVFDSMLSKLPKVTLAGLTALGVFAEFISGGYADAAATQLITAGSLPAGTTGAQLVSLLCTEPDPAWTATIPQPADSDAILGNTTPGAYLLEASDVVAALAS